MNFNYIQDNIFKYSNLNSDGIFYQTSSSVGSLAFNGSGTYYIYKEGNNVNFLQHSMNQAYIDINGPGELFNSNSTNLVYTAYVNVSNPDIVAYSSAKVILTVNGEDIVKEIQNTVHTTVEFTNKIQNKQNNVISISCENCTINGKLVCTWDKIVPNDNSTLQ